MSKKVFIFDVELVCKERWRIQLTADKVPTARQILKMIQEETLDDIIDDEVLEVQSIGAIEELSQDDDEEEMEEEE